MRSEFKKIFHSVVSFFCRNISRLEDRGERKLFLNSEENQLKCNIVWFKTLSPEMFFFFVQSLKCTKRLEDRGERRKMCLNSVENL